MRIGVTGAGGYIGSCVSQQLLNKNMDVVPLDNFSYSKLYERRINDVEIRNADVANFDALETYLEGVDCIFHLAAISGIDECNKHIKQTATTNLTGTENIAALCAEHHINLIFASSCAVVGNPTIMPITGNYPRHPLNSYAKSKYYGEEVILRYATHGEFSSYIFMIANVYGAHCVNNQIVTKNTVINKFVTQALNKSDLTVYKPGTQGRDFIHVLDVSRAFVKALDYIGDKDSLSMIPIGSGKSTSVRTIARLTQSVCFAQTGYEPWIECIDNPRENEILCSDFRLDTEKAEKTIDFKAEVDMEEAIREMFRMQPHSITRK